MTNLPAFAMLIRSALLRESHPQFTIPVLGRTQPSCSTSTRSPPGSSGKKSTATPVRRPKPPLRYQLAEPTRLLRLNSPKPRSSPDA